MNELLYVMPHWAMGFLVIGGTVAASFAIYGVMHRVMKLKLAPEEAAGGPAMAGILATVTSLLLAFTAVSVWEAFRNAEGAAFNEATAATMLARDLASYGSPSADAAREELRGYLRSVVDEEWPLLQKAQVSQDSRVRLDHIFRAIALITPRNTRDEIVAAEIWARINDLAKFRRERLASAEAGVPSTLWAVVLAGTLLTIVCAGTMPPNAFGWSMMGALSCSFGLVFFFILAMDKPFSGRESVPPAAIEETLANMDFWDKTESKPYHSLQAAKH
jgi:uncharacterized membrane protein HdeD (DUF308 family)